MCRATLILLLALCIHANDENSEQDGIAARPSGLVSFLQSVIQAQPELQWIQKTATDLRNKMKERRDIVKRPGVELTNDQDSRINIKEDSGSSSQEYDRDSRDYMPFDEEFPENDAIKRGWQLREKRESNSESTEDDGKGTLLETNKVKMPLSGFLQESEFKPNNDDSFSNDLDTDQSQSVNLNELENLKFDSEKIASDKLDNQESPKFTDIENGGLLGDDIQSAPSEEQGNPYEFHEDEHLQNVKLDLLQEIRSDKYKTSFETARKPTADSVNPYETIDNMSDSPIGRKLMSKPGSWEPIEPNRLHVNYENKYHSNPREESTMTNETSGKGYANAKKLFKTVPQLDMDQNVAKTNYSSKNDTRNEESRVSKSNPLVSKQGANEAISPESIKDNGTARGSQGNVQVSTFINEELPVSEKNEKQRISFANSEAINSPLRFRRQIDPFDPAAYFFQRNVDEKRSSTSKEMQQKPKDSILNLPKLRYKDYRYPRHECNSTTDITDRSTTKLPPPHKYSNLSPGEERSQNELDQQMQDAISGKLARRLVEEIYTNAQSNSHIRQHIYPSLKKNPYTEWAGNNYTDKFHKRTQEVFHKMSKVLENIVDEQFKQQECTILSADQRQFVTWLLSESQESAHAKDLTHFLFKNKTKHGKNDTHEKSNFDVQKGMGEHEHPICETAEQAENLKKKADLLANLERQYKELSEQDKVRVESVGEYLREQENNLRLLLTNLETPCDRSYEKHISEGQIARSNHSAAIHHKESLHKNIVTSAPVFSVTETLSTHFAKGIQEDSSRFEAEFSTIPFITHSSQPVIHSTPFILHENSTQTMTKHFLTTFVIADHTLDHSPEVSSEYAFGGYIVKDTGYSPPPSARRHKIHYQPARGFSEEDQLIKHQLETLGLEKGFDSRMHHTKHLCPKGHQFHPHVPGTMMPVVSHKRAMNDRKEYANVMADPSESLLRYVPKRTNGYRRVYKGDGSEPLLVPDYRPARELEWPKYWSDQYQYDAPLFNDPYEP